MYHECERIVEIENGPFTLAANDSHSYYEGWVLPQPLDPYGEPQHIIFEAERILREVE